MPQPVTAPPVFMLHAEKHLLTDVLGAAPASRESDSIQTLLGRTGMNDGDVQFSPEQASFLGTNLVAFLGLPALKGSKYDTAMGREIARSIAGRVGANAGS